MTEFFGKKVILNEPVEYIGEAEDPAENPYMKAYAKALKEIYQPDRLNPEDHIVGVNKMICDSQNNENK